MTWRDNVVLSLTMLLLGVSVGLLISSCPTPAFAGATTLEFDGPVTTTVSPYQSPLGTVFGGVYEEGDFRVRPDGGIWYAAGVLGGPAGHFYSNTMSGLSQYLAVTRISGRTILIGGEFTVKALTVQATDPRDALILSVIGQNEDGNPLYNFMIHLPVSTTPLTVRLDTQFPVGLGLTPVNRILIGAMGATGVRVLSMVVEPRAVGVKTGGGRNRP